MIHEFTLHRSGGGAGTPHIPNPAAFTWDDLKGTFGGEHGKAIAEMAEFYGARGSVVSHPYPTGYQCTAPQTNVQDLAVMLSQWYTLEGALAEAFAKVQSTMNFQGPEGYVY